MLSRSYARTISWTLLWIQAGHAFPDDGETLSDDEPLSNLASQHAHKRWKQDKTKDANANGGQDAMDTG